jgi:hypothetical protein
VDGIRYIYQKAEFFETKWLQKLEVETEFLRLCPPIRRLVIRAGPIADEKKA